MKIKETGIKGCFIIERDVYADERGYFSRAFDKKSLEEAGMGADFVQSNLSQNKKKNTIRGLHSQVEPYAEDKLVMCTRGMIRDVCVDVRIDSPTYKQYVYADLSEENACCLYVPKGCAHGYATFTDDAQVLYYVTHEYVPNSEKCYRYDDPAFNVDWGIDLSEAVISEKDRKHKLIEL